MTPEEVVVEEWRVTGQPNSVSGIDFPPYSFTWRSNRNYDSHARTEGALLYTAEQAARSFCEVMTDWEDGPHLEHRYVTYSQWVEDEL